MKGLGITAVILLACSMGLASQSSEVVSYREIDQREYRDREVGQPVWPNERVLPGRAADYHELYPWQEMPGLEFDEERETRCLPAQELDHHTEFGPAMPDIEFDGGSNGIARPYDELSAPQTEEIARSASSGGIGQARQPGQARRPVQARRLAQARQIAPARRPGHARPPVALDGGDNAKSLPPIESDHHTEFGPAMPNIEFDGWYETRCQKPRQHDSLQEVRLLPPALAW
jgi:hypothetical protein